MQIQTINFDNSGMYRSTFKDETFNVRNHIHQCSEIIYVTEGTLYSNVDGEERILEGGEAAFISPFAEHTFHAVKDTKLWLAVFSNEFLIDFMNSKDIYKKRNTSYFKMSDSLMAFLSDKLPDSGEEIVPFDYTERRKMLLIILSIWNEYAESSYVKQEKAKQTLLSEILLYLDEHYSEPLTIKDVSRALGYTPRHISRQLALLQDYNFRSILNAFRIEHAKTMIRRSTSKLIDISMECGFVSERTFFRAFLAFEGITPNEYRKSIAFPSKNVSN